MSESPAFAVGDRVATEVEPARAGVVTDRVFGGGTFHGYRIRWDDGFVSIWSPSGRGLRHFPANPRGHPDGVNPLRAAEQAC